MDARLPKGLPADSASHSAPQHLFLLHPLLSFSSATVPNTLEFADWVGRTKRKHMWVISTDKRPVPLQHFLWCKHKLFQVLDGTSGKFLSDGFKAAKNEGLTDKVRAMQKRGIFKRPSLKQAKSSWVVLINYLKSQELLPVVIFAFSKKVCEVSERGGVQGPLRRFSLQPPPFSICVFHSHFVFLLLLLYSTFCFVCRTARTACTTWT